MRDKADLSDKADELEHLVLQLQGETDTIGNYNTLSFIVFICLLILISEIMPAGYSCDDGLCLFTAGTSDQLILKKKNYVI